MVNLTQALRTMQPTQLLKHTLVFCTILVFGLLLFTTPAHAQTPGEWKGVCTDTGTPDGVATIQGFQCLIGNVLQIAVSIIGMAGFVMLIIGAFSYLLSGGNAKGIDDSQKTMTAAVVGLVIALSAFIILRLIADFTGVQSILNFKISLPSYTSPN